jgi:hypothetical protein
VAPQSSSRLVTFLCVGESLVDDACCWGFGVASARLAVPVLRERTAIAVTYKCKTVFLDVVCSLRLDFMCQGLAGANPEYCIFPRPPMTRDSLMLSNAVKGDPKTLAGLAVLVDLKHTYHAESCG